jgi:hypothetical protein
LKFFISGCSALFMRDAGGIDAEPAEDERSRIISLLARRRRRSTIWCACR